MTAALTELWQTTAPAVLGMFCYLYGLWLAYSSILVMRRLSEEQRDASWSQLATRIIIASAFLAFPEAAGITLGSVFGGDGKAPSSSILAYSVPADLDDGGQTTLAIRMVLFFAFFLGLLGIARGLAMAKDVGDGRAGQGASIGAALTFIICGAFSTNMTATLCLASQYFDVLDGGGFCK